MLYGGAALFTTCMCANGDAVANNRMRYNKNKLEND